MNQIEYLQLEIMFSSCITGKDSKVLSITSIDIIFDAQYATGGLCLMGLITSPSGDKVCFMKDSDTKSYFDAIAYCKSLGFYGLLEARNEVDTYFIGDLTTCKLEFCVPLFFPLLFFC